MKNINFFFVFIVVVCLYSCTKNDPVYVVNRYYDALNTKDYKAVSACLAEDIILTEGGEKLVDSRLKYYRHFQWDSVFEPSYRVLEIKNTNDSLIIKVSKTCKRFEFLEHNPLITFNRFIIKDNHIIRIEIIGYEKVNWDVWNSKREALVTWIDENHPHLSGFIYDQSKYGAECYMKAIDLFNNR